jgi:ABC-type multidrug transport system fused ATPase/permease subunit
LERTENWTLIEQEPCLFTGTLRDNLLLACSAADAADDAECGRALRLAGLADFPLDTWLGERGRALSGGERQRVAIARAILRRAHLVIADEACAHLPLPEEKKIFQMFQSLPEQPAVLWISHRL